MAMHLHNLTVSKINKVKLNAVEIIVKCSKHPLIEKIYSIIRLRSYIL